MFAGRVRGDGVHVADAGDAGRAGQVDDHAAAAAVRGGHVAEGRLDAQVGAFLERKRKGEVVI